jgi:TonB family protein
MKTCPLCDTSYPSSHTNCPTDGARLIESRDLEPGVVVCSKYRIDRVLGRGGMGTVYLAQHILLDEPRALKFMSPELSQDAKFLKRFRMEAKAAIALQHPNIAGVLDLDQAEDGSPFIAMEYVHGRDLRAALKEAPFAVERALSIARGIALGLTKAHAKGIVHRDIKPENILLIQEPGAPEVPKILDFGIAAMKENTTAISRTRGLMLTPEYAAPEQWKGLPAQELDGRVDLYALGCVLHEMLTGSTSLHAHNTEGWMYQHLQVAPEAPSKLRPDLARWKGLDELVLHLLEKDRDRRTSSAEASVRELDALRLGTAIAHQSDRAVPVVGSVVPVVSAPAPPSPQLQPTRRPADEEVPVPAPPEPAPVRKTWTRQKLVVGAVLLILAGVSVYAALFWRHRAQQEALTKALDLFKAGQYAQAFPSVERCAEGGDTRCQRAMAEYYAAQLNSRSGYWYRKLADAGDADGMYYVGWDYENGIGVAKDLDQAVTWYRKAAAAGSEKAKQSLERLSAGASHQSSAHGPQSAKPLPPTGGRAPNEPSQTDKPSSETAKAGTAPDKEHEGGNDGIVYHVGEGVSAPKRIYTPDPQFSEAARRAKYQGTCVLDLIVDAQGRTRDVHVVRSLGMGLDENAVEAVKQWRFQPSMKDGRLVDVEINVEVNFHLYDQAPAPHAGIGDKATNAGAGSGDTPVPVQPQPQPPVDAGGSEGDAKRGQELFLTKHYDEAFPLLKRAAESGDAPSQSRLGFLYQDGLGTKKDYAEAVRWYQKSAEGGDAMGMNDLGTMYQRGWGVPAQDNQQALMWYRKAAAAGNATAMSNLGFMYNRGIGVSRDYQQAFAWYRKSAEAGNAQAMNYVGEMYQAGIGVTGDVDQAVYWYRKAAALGVEVAKRNLKSLGKD